ncbi:hypothetical protein MTR67_012266, partial [Solanum verrucosum]
MVYFGIEAEGVKPDDFVKVTALKKFCKGGEFSSSYSKGQSSGDFQSHPIQSSLQRSSFKRHGGKGRGGHPSGHGGGQVGTTRVHLGRRNGQTGDQAHCYVFPGSSAWYATRDIDFCIDLESGTHPISIPPYRMTLPMLIELKAQLQELLGKGFIRLCASHWGDRVLFLKKDGAMLMQERNVIAYASRQLKVSSTFTIFVHSKILEFEALYGRRCRSPIGWFDALDMRPWGTDLLGESLDKVKFILEKILAAQSKHKKYADCKVRDLEFLEGDQVLLKVAPMKGVMRFGKRVLLDDSLSYEEEHVAILYKEV